MNDSPIPASGRVPTHVAARITGLAESTLRYYRHANKGPISYLIGSKVYYDVADRVRIERDETGHPCKGTWPQFRGRTGTVVEINHDRKRPHLTEWAAVLASGPTERRTNHR